jgi:thiol-disulfide isomerase/thioredoxin
MLLAVLLLALAGCDAAPAPAGQPAPLPTPFPTQVGEQAWKPPPVPTQPAGADSGDALPFPMGTSVVSPPRDDSLPPPVGTIVLEEPEVGRPAPDIEVIRMEDGQPMLLSELKGRPIWINFWATWCPPCKEEMPAMEEIYQQYKSTDLVILGIDADEDPGMARRFVADHGFSWRFAHDPERRAAFSYLVFAIPTHIFIQRDGTIQDIVISGLTKAGMEHHVTQLLQQ